MIDLSGKVILITGGGGGIGAACVRKTVALGGQVVLHDINDRGEGKRLAKELGPEKCHFIAADLSQGATVPQLWADAVRWRGRVDVLVNNAGIYEPASIGDEFDAWARSWQKTLEVNLVSPGHLCREAIRSFQRSGGGIIINMASRAGFRGDDPDYAHYAAAKGGILALTRTIARGFGRDNITCFAVAPGFVRTDLNQKFFEQFGVEGAAKDIPLGEIAEPEDIANVVVFLSSGLARHATGSTVHVNGASYVH
jgi:3-oxoacyl-[acyl-carrier protein] reductase